MKNLKYDSDKVNDYSKKELAEMIFNGEVSREQVNEDGLYLYHRPMLDKELSLMEQEEHDWTEATNHNTVGSFKVYLDKYNPTIVEGETITDGWVENTVYVGRHVDDAIRLQTVEKIDGAVKENDRDKAAWNKAEEGNSIESYNEYITVYDKRPPAYRGQYVDEAKLRIRELQDKFDWDKAVSENTMESYKTYLSKYDVSTSSYRGAYISEAVEAIKRLTLQSMPHTYPVDPLKNETEDWEKAVRADNIEAYKCYISKYEPLEGKYVVDAKNAIERLLEEKVWSEALNNDNFVGYKKYVTIYQNKNSKHLVEAEQKLNQLKKDLACIIDNITLETTDDKEWEKACKANTITAYRLYLSKFDGQNTSQKGKYVSEANKRIDSLMDEACWEDAVKQNIHAAYQNYLKQYPNGHHCDEVKRIINPNSKSAGCLKALLWFCLAVGGVFIVWQYLYYKWPFVYDNQELGIDTICLDTGIVDDILIVDSAAIEIIDDTAKEVTIPSNSENKSIDRDCFIRKNLKQKVPTSTKEKNYKELAESGDTRAYAVLAKMYLNKNKYDQAAYWANKAWYANANRVLASEVIEYLSDIDYYVGAKYKKPY